MLDFGLWPLLNNAPIFDRNDDVREASQARVVGHHQDGAAAIFGDRREELHDRAAGCAIERGRRLVGENCRRSGDDGAGRRRRSSFPGLTGLAVNASGSAAAKLSSRMGSQAAVVLWAAALFQGEMIIIG